MILNSGATSIKGINPFAVGNSYQKYDIVYFSGYTNAGTEIKKESVSVKDFKLGSLKPRGTRRWIYNSDTKNYYKSEVITYHWCRRRTRRRTAQSFNFQFSEFTCKKQLN